jgi:hypothetical protein
LGRNGEKEHHSLYPLASFILHIYASKTMKKTKKTKKPGKHMLTKRIPNEASFSLAPLTLASLPEMCSKHLTQEKNKKKEKKKLLIMPQ